MRWIIIIIIIIHAPTHVEQHPVVEVCLKHAPAWMWTLNLLTFI